MTYIPNPRPVLVYNVFQMTVSVSVTVFTVPPTATIGHRLTMTDLRLNWEKPEAKPKAERPIKCKRVRERS